LIRSDETTNSQDDKARHNPFNEFDEQYQISKEKWKRVATLRRHIEDVVDLAWSPCERFLLTGSVDNMALVWDVKKAEVLYTLSKHDGYVQGVAWDPLNSFITTICTDRNLRFFNTQTKKVMAKVNKMPSKASLTAEDEKVKSTLIFYDDTLATISRRMSFSPNGELLIVPSGIVELDDDEKDSEKDKFLNVVHIFSRDNLKKYVLS
jgi:chromatin assembly factor 1 subunit B